MRSFWLGILLLAGCAETAGEPDVAAARAAQERACAAVVAQHVALPVGAVVAEWHAAGAAGVDVVVVRHGDTFHTCEVDEQLRVRALQHPEAG